MTWRQAAFVCGWGAVWIAVASPLARLHHVSLTIHMTQHLLIMVVGAPLILLGMPAASFWTKLDERRWLPPRGLLAGVARAIARMLRSAPARGIGRVLTHPAICWMAGVGVVIGWHVPAAFSLAIHSAAWHDLQQATFLAAGLMFWWPVVRVWSTAPASTAWSVPVYLFAATLPCDALSAFLVFCDRAVYPAYGPGPLLFQMSPLQDQACAGALMWVVVTGAYLIPAVIVTMRLLSPAVKTVPVALGRPGSFGGQA